MGRVSCGGLQSSLRTDFKNDVAILEMQILAILEKTLAGPWMKKFYTAADVQIDHVEAIQIVRDIIGELKVCSEDPILILSHSCDLLGHDLNEADATLQKLRVLPFEANQPLSVQFLFSRDY